MYCVLNCNSCVIHYVISLFIYTLYRVIEYIQIDSAMRWFKNYTYVCCASQGQKNKMVFAIYILNTILIRNQANRNKSLSLISSLIAIYKEN